MPKRAAVLEREVIAAGTAIKLGIMGFIFGFSLIERRLHACALTKGTAAR
jgi:hypothetical protein